ncbi:MAG TPA: hypothetical protein VHD32_13425 [Candidatus Didemnitutus sp.]|nr:hypothetical protein [Candidatus Didemnitutus sp.]
MRSGSAPVDSNLAPCRVRFGHTRASTGATDSHAGALHVALPVLAGDADELILAAAEAPRISGDFVLHEGDGLLAGFAVAPTGLELESAAARLYDALFAATDGLHLFRIWNYVPRINAVEGALENYRLFCRGRSLAFERHFGAEFRKILPAASAVGAVDGPLALGFLAGDAVPHHFENPRQVPAFEYPPQYGPRPPSFARATAVRIEGERRIFVSGTAAITGHATMAMGDVNRQVACTVENLALIAEAAGAGRQVGRKDGWARRFKAYIRHGSDQAAVASHLERLLLTADDSVQYLQADLCRSDLLVEIEAILSRPE